MAVPRLDHPSATPRRTEAGGHEGIELSPRPSNTPTPVATGLPQRAAAPNGRQAHAHRRRPRTHPHHLHGAQLTIHAKIIQTRNQQRDEALRSKFLDTDNHPAISFTSTKVEQAGDTNFAVTGDLTIRGVTKPVTVDFKLTGAKTDPRGTFRVGFEAASRPTARTGE
jgi:hypothetical protein